MTVDQQWLDQVLASAPPLPSPARAARLRTLLATTAAPAPTSPGAETAANRTSAHQAPERITNAAS